MLPSWSLLCPIVLVIYLGLVRTLRYRRENELKAQYKYSDRASLSQMTVQDAWAIQLNLITLEFPWAFMSALKMAVYAVNGIPSITRLLAKTNRLEQPSDRIHKRYTDMTLLIGEFLVHPPDDDRSNKAISRMNCIHQLYQQSGQISNDDMLYTLSLLASFPIEWVARHEWRGLNELEQCAMGTYWKSIGEDMGIDYSPLPSATLSWKDGLHWLEEVSIWGKEYRLQNLRPDPNNTMVASSAMDVVLGTTPPLLRSLARWGLLAALDNPLRRALVLPSPPSLIRLVFWLLVEFRRWSLRHLSLPRPYWLRLNPLPASPDQDGRYHIDIAGAKPYYVKPTMLSRWGPSAWARRILGLPVPGDQGDAFCPKGYCIEELGPSLPLTARMKTMECKILARRRGRCPFG